MLERLSVYHCEECGNIVTVLHGGSGELVCCGKPMKKLEEKTADSTVEKHVPMIEKTADGYKVTVGSTLHPMKEDHYIEWIELVTDNKTLIAFLNPSDEPVAYFKTNETVKYAREYCNLHGLWKVMK